MKQQHQTARTSSSKVTGLYGYVVTKVHSRMWFFSHFLVIAVLVACLISDPSLSSSKTYAAGSHDFIRSISKEVTPESDPPFTIGEVTSMVTGSDGFIYAGSGTTIYKLSSSGSYIKQWEANGTIGILNFGTDTGLLYKTGDNGVQSFTADGVEVGTVPVNGSLVRGGGSNHMWYGVGPDSGPVTDLSSTASDSLFIYTSDGNLVNSTGLYTGEMSVLSLSVGYSSMGGGDILYLGTPGKIISLSTNGTERQTWEDGTGSTPYNSIVLDSRGNLYASDSNQDIIRKFDKNLQPLTDWGGTGSGDLEFNNPGKIAVSNAGNVYIDDVGNSSIKQYQDVSSIAITSPDRIPSFIRPNNNFSYTIQTDNETDDLTFSIIDAYGNVGNLPLGLHLNTDTGEIYGTLDPSIETTVFSASFIVNVRSSNGSYTEKTISLFGADLSEPVSIVTTTLPAMQYGKYLQTGSGNFSAYANIEVSGGHEFGVYPLAFSVVDGELPPGVQLEPTGGVYPLLNKGKFSGRPSTSGSYTFTVRVESTDPLVPSFDEQEYTIVVLQPNEVPTPFINDGKKTPIIEVKSVVRSGEDSIVSGEGPLGQEIKVYMDGVEVGNTMSDQNGRWEYRVLGINGVGHTFSVSWEANNDIAFLLGSDTSDVLFSETDPYSSVQIFDTVSGEVLKNIVMPEGFYATQVIPNSDSTKLYLSGLDIHSNLTGNGLNSVRVLEYDILGGKLNFVADIPESLDSISSLLLNSDGSVLYTLTSSGLYAIDTSTHGMELISRVDVSGMYPLSRFIEFNSDETKLIIADHRFADGAIISSSDYLKRYIVVDLLNGSSTVEETLSTTGLGNWHSVVGLSFLARGNNRTYLAYGDGSVRIINEDDNSSNVFDFDLSRQYEEYPTVEDTAAGYIYDKGEDALYSLILTVVKNSENDDGELSFSLRKLDLQTGVVTRTYGLPFLPRLGVFSQDGEGLYLFDDTLSPFRSGVYKLDLDNGDIATVNETIASTLLGVKDGGPIVSNFFFTPSSRNVVSGFSVHSDDFIAKEEPEDPDKPVDPDKPSEDEPKVHPPRVVPHIKSEDSTGGGSGEVIPNGAARVAEAASATDASDKQAPLRGLVNKFASVLGVEPIVVARVFPWTIIGALFGLLLTVIIGLIKQLIVVSKMKKLVRRQELLNLEKTWLLSLSSHYLKTPLTIIQSGQEMLKQGNDKDRLVVGMSSLNAVVSRVVNNLRNDSVVAEMKAPEKIRYKHASFWQPKVIVPVFMTLGLVIALNIVFTMGANLYPGTVNIISQICMVAVGGGLLYVAYDSWSERKALEKYQKKLLVYEEGLDSVRNKFVLSMAKELMPEIKKAKSFVTVNTPVHAKRNINKGLEQLERTTEKFLLICQLEREELKKQAAELGLKGTIEKAREQSKHPKSPVSLLLSDESTLSQPEVLLKKVFASLIDNAAEHSNSKKPVEIYSDEGKKVRVSVQDFGKGIEKDKLNLLFKPLSKVEEDFTSQGMGLSLYLNRLIMHYLNGEISATSKVGFGTKMIVEIPKKLS